MNTLKYTWYISFIDIDTNATIYISWQLGLRNLINYS